MVYDIYECITFDKCCTQVLIRGVCTYRAIYAGSYKNYKLKNLYKLFFRSRQ